MRLQPDPLVHELQRLAPEIIVSGGSFAHWLPPPAEVSPPTRAKLMKRTKQAATGECLTSLLERAGLPAIEPHRLGSGGRNWPTGHVGSVSHKGTKVLAALAPIARVRLLGIDIENRHGAKDLSGISGLIAGDKLVLDSGVEESVVMFSVKEAIFKALHPALNQRLSFSDVAVSWKAVRPSALSGKACVAGVALDVRCSTAIPPWAVSVALVTP